MRKTALALAPKRDVPLAATPAWANRRAREALAEKHAREREDDGAESCPDENRLRVARRRAHRRPENALAHARTICRRKGCEDRCAHALGQHGDNLRANHGGRAGCGRADLAEEARAARPRRQKQAHRHNDSQAGSGEPGCKQSRIEREPMRMAPQSGDVGERRQQQPHRRDGADRNRQGAGGKQIVSIDRGGEDQLEVRAPKQRAGEVRHRLGDDPWNDERGAGGENRRDPRKAVGAVFNADEPTSDRVGCDVERYEQERDQSRQCPQRQRAEHRCEATRAQAQIVQDETRKSRQGSTQPQNHAARPA
jgi:hypothetical protein